MLDKLRGVIPALILMCCACVCTGAAAQTRAAASAGAAGGLPAWVKSVGARRGPRRRRVCAAGAHGAVGDGNTNSTKAIQKAIDACARAGGGVVDFKPGEYVTGALFLKSNVHLRVDGGVTLLGSQEDADYPPIFTR